MERNVGGLDRTVRLVLGPLALLVGLGVLVDLLPATTLVGGALVGGGAVLTVTGVTQRCIINRLLGVDTCRRA